MQYAQFMDDFFEAFKEQIITILNCSLSQLKKWGPIRILFFKKEMFLFALYS